VAIASVAALAFGGFSFDAPHVSAVVAQVAPARAPTSVTPTEPAVLQDAIALVEAQEDTGGVVEKAPPDPDEAGVPPAQVPIQVPPAR
jgi:hypothetical protein